MSDLDLEQLSELAGWLKMIDMEATGLRKKRLHLMREARAMGASYSEIAEVCGVTKAYVHQALKTEVETNA